MRNIQLLLLLFILGASVFSGCSLEEDPVPQIEETLFNIKDEFKGWLLPFDTVDRNISYKNSLDSVAFVVIERTFDFSERTYADCRVDGRLSQCEFESVNLAFPEDTHPDNFQPYVSIFLFGPNELRIMANRVGLDASLARFDEDPNEIFSELEDNFSASYDSSYVHNGIPRQAVIVETITLSDVVSGAIIPPLRMVLVKGIGMVEWEDYNGNTWILQD